MGRRRRRSRGRSTRRRFLAKASLVGGGVLLFGGTEAFSQLGASRAVSMNATEDGNALLGLDIASSVRAGTADQNLVALTNNASDTIDVSLSLSNPDQGTLSPSALSIESGATRSVLVSVDADSPTGSDALGFDVVASNETVSVSLERRVTVTSGPAFKQQIRDDSRNSNAAFTISYRVSQLPNFDRVELEVENLDAGHIGTTTYVEGVTEQTLSYPQGGGSDGGAAGNTYEFRFCVYDGSGEVTDLSTVVTTTADGSNPPGDDLADEGDPTLVGFSVTNDVQWTNNRFTVDYEVDPGEDFGEVTVVFDNTEHDWSDATKTNDSAPTGTVIYPSANNRQGGVNGDTYDVTVTVSNQSGIPVDSGTVSLTAGSSETVDWP
ncbi:hypothetical protein [Natrinema sp. DC36]|uniref:hypothetical protein n=1 Tax=Natrinema sp. DC36 TaxID=2878680 RepID=UPI001CF0745E|nr:hypothetical protein [Natrinema sp. DC36]